jgi:two-component system chemotaxis response regulator CheY
LLLALLKKKFDICDSADDGRQGVEAFIRALDKGEPYDLICLDIMMPVLDGQAALQEIRKIEQQRGIGGSNMVKVIMTTALDGAKDIMTAFMKGACEGYLTKPYDRKKLDDYLEKFGFQ